MSGPDGPTAADLRRLRKARSIARAEVAEAVRVYENARLKAVRPDVAAAREVFLAARCTAFQRELMSTVRCVSPFLVSLVRSEGLDLADVVGRIEPPPRWPRLPRLSHLIDGAEDVHAIRYAYAAGPYGFRSMETRHLPDQLPGIILPLDCGGSAHVRVAGHSVEVRMELSRTVFETRFGELRITTTWSIPRALAATAIHRPIEYVVRHSASDGFGWRVRFVETTGAATVFVVSTGVVPWRAA